MTVRFSLAMVVGVVGAIAAPWPWLAVTIAIALPMALGIWLVAHLTTSRLVVRNVTPPRGTSGWDRDAFLMPGVDLDFDRIEYRNFPLVVLNLRAPSLLLGFRLGGIVGHKFLAPYRVSMDLVNSELRLEKF